MRTTHETSQRTIAVLGTGIMGAPMARNLHKAGFTVRAWNRARDRAAPLENDGITVADTPEAAAKDADFVMTMILDGEAIAFAAGLGLDPQLFLDTVKGSATDNPFLHVKGQATINHDFAPAFPTAGAYKDIKLILAAAQASGMSHDVMTAVQDKLERTVQQGHGDKDMAAMYHATAR